MRGFVTGSVLSLLLATGSAVSAAPLFSDDFSEGDGTTIGGKAADVGGPWVENSGTNLAVQAGAVNTTGAARVLFSPFSRSLAAGETLTMSFTSDTVNLFTDGYAGVSLFSGFTGSANVGSERIFVGDRGGSNAGWGVENAAAFIQSADKSLPATVGLTYVYDTGAAELFVNGTSVGTATLESGIAANALRIANGSGGDIKVDNLVVNAAAVPEPATAGLVGLIGAGLLARRRRAQA